MTFFHPTIHHYYTHKGHQTRTSLYGGSYFQILTRLEMTNSIQSYGQTCIRFLICGVLEECDNTAFRWPSIEAISEYIAKYQCTFFFFLNKSIKLARFQPRLGIFKL